MTTLETIYRNRMTRAAQERQALGAQGLTSYAGVGQVASVLRSTDSATRFTDFHHDQPRRPF